MQNRTASCTNRTAKHYHSIVDRTSFPAHMCRARLLAISNSGNRIPAQRASKAVPFCTLSDDDQCALAEPRLTKSIFILCRKMELLSAHILHNWYELRKLHKFAIFRWAEKMSSEKVQSGIKISYCTATCLFDENCGYRTSITNH